MWPTHAAAGAKDIRVTGIPKWVVCWESGKTVELKTHLPEYERVGLNSLLRPPDQTLDYFDCVDDSPG